MNIKQIEESISLFLKMADDQSFYMSPFQAEEIVERRLNKTADFWQEKAQQLGMEAPPEGVVLESGGSSSTSSDVVLDDGADEVLDEDTSGEIVGDETDETDETDGTDELDVLPTTDDVEETDLDSASDDLDVEPDADTDLDSIDTVSSAAYNDAIKKMATINKAALLDDSISDDDDLANQALDGLFDSEDSKNSEDNPPIETFGLETDDDSDLDGFDSENDDSDLTGLNLDETGDDLLDETGDDLSGLDTVSPHIDESELDDMLSSELDSDISDEDNEDGGIDLTDILGPDQSEDDTAIEGVEDFENFEDEK